MEITAEEDHMFSIWGSKQTIDNYIRNNDYRAAFSLLIVILERLDNDEKKEFIEYYRRTMKPYDISTSVIPEKNI